MDISDGIKPTLSKDIQQSFASIHSVLLVEDNHICQLLTKDLLESIDLKVTIVGNGTDALHVANQTKYDLILMDIGLPDLHGVNVIQKICRESKYNRATKGILLTAHAKTPTIHEDHQDSHPFYLISKPLTLEKLAFALDN